MKFLLLTLLTAFSLTVDAQSTCTTLNAHPIDLDVAFIELLTILAIVGKRSFPLDKRALDCSSTEECLSFKNVPFCYDRAVKTFHTEDGTTGNFNTGVYTLPDGRQGNMYTGPHPTPTSGEVISTTISSNPPLVTATQTVIKTGSGGTTNTAPSQVATQSSASVPKSEAGLGGRPISSLMLGFWMVFIGLWL